MARDSDKQVLGMSVIKQFVRFWSEANGNADKGVKMGSRKKNKRLVLVLGLICVKAVGPCARTQSVPVCLHSSLGCE